jgi:hypothetical protein
MKKIFTIIVLVAGIFLTFNQNVISWVKSNFASNPKPYYQQRLEFFENLSREYYGVTNYAKELEVVNRSFVINEISSDRIELIIPSMNAITRLKQRQSLASVENYAGTQIVKTIRRLSSQAAATKKVSESVEPSKSSMLILLVGIIVISTAVALVSYFKYRNKTKSLDMPAFPGDEPIGTDDSILVNFDLAGYEEKYQQSNSVCLESGI